MTTETRDYLYEAARKFIAVLPIMAGVSGLFIDAPFGRFAPTGDNGRIAWFCMEFPPLLTFPYFLHNAFSLNLPSTVLATLFVLHYINRSTVSVLRMPARARIHLAVVPLTSIFNAANGFAMATYLSSPPAQSYLLNAFSRPTFYMFLITWAAGFLGNIAHDEVLYALRRNVDGEGKAGNRAGEQYYGIPHGMLYEYISFPNYLCELCEWLAFALAAAPLPSMSTVMNSYPTITFEALLFADIPFEFAHPYIFFVATLLPMLPRAYRAHIWYLKKFPTYPKSRRAILPYLL